MQEIKHDILLDPSKFELICLPCSCYQKKDGTMPVPKEGFFHELVERHPSLPQEIGKGVEKYGNCPALLSGIPNTETKFCTFPIAPTSLRAENPDDYVFQRLQGKFKPTSLLPGWTLLPRSDMLEFSSLKLGEIIKYYKLTKVAIAFEMFTLELEDKKEYDRIKTIIETNVKSNIYMVSQPVESPHGTVHGGMVSSSVTYEEE